MTVTDEPPVAPTAADQAMAAVRAYCGWHIAPSREEMLILDGPGGNTLCLPSLHVTDIALITEVGVDLDGTLDYSWSEAGIVRRSWSTSINFGWTGAWWTTELRGLSVDLTHGYDEWPIELAGIINAGAQRITDNPAGLKQQTVGPFSEQYGDRSSAGVGSWFDAADAAVLARYRLPPRP